MTSYEEWTQNSEAYRAYAAAAARCDAVFAVARLQHEYAAAIRVIISLEGRGRRHEMKNARAHCADVKKRLAAAKLAARTPAQIEADNAAERARQEAQIAAAHRAEIARTRGPLATPRQVAYIETLIARRHRDGDDSGFYSGPTTREGIEQLTRREASTYIDSLTGNY